MGLLIALIVVAAALAGAGGGEERARSVGAAGAPPSSAPPSQRITVEVNGDLLIHGPVYQRALALGGGRFYDFRPMLRYIRPYIEGADLAICHVETPMTPGPPSGYPLFRTPPDLARSIRAAGWDACDTASNHSLDAGQAGIDATGRALDRAGVRHTGSFPTPRAQRQTLMLHARGVRVAFLAYTTITNGIPSPHPWSLNLADPRRILADARRARARGAQVVIVNLHWGEEYQHEPSAQQERLARRLARSPDITAIVGQHVHVVQPIRRVAGKLVVFGEGNLLSNQTSACCVAASQDGLIALLHLRVQGSQASVESIDYVPVWVRHPDFAVLPVGAALRRGLADPSALRASYARTVSVVGRVPGVRVIPAHLGSTA